MSFTVRIFGHKGIVALHANDGGQLRTDNVFQLEQPYLWAQQLTASGVAAASAAAGIPTGFTLDPTTLLRVEIPDGQSIRYEVNTPNRSVAAGTVSPSLSGKDQIQFGAGWTISIIDASGLP